MANSVPPFSVGDLVKHMCDKSRNYGLILIIPPTDKNINFKDVLLEIYWDTGEISLVFDHEIILI